MLKKTTLVFVFTLVSIEILLRVFNYSEYKKAKSNNKIMSHPSPFFENNKLIGYNQKTGSYIIYLNDSAISYRVNINPDKTRYNPYSLKKNNKSINIYGCSFFAGMGLNDNQVVSSKLQLLMPEYNINNYSIPGHGLTSQYLLLKQAIKTNQKPDIAVFELASFHLERNVGAYSYIKNFISVANRPSFFVKANIKNNHLVFETFPVKEQKVILSEYFASLNLINTVLEKTEFSKQELLKTNNLLVDSLYSLTLENDIEILFHIITNDTESEKMLNYIKSKNLPFIYSKINFKDTENNLYPRDGHPNERCHFLYAQELFNYIKK
jgi:hypothetical protein